MAQQRPVITAAASRSPTNNTDHPLSCPSSPIPPAPPLVPPPTHHHHHHHHTSYECYYDDTENETFERTCPLGQFFLNPQKFLWLRCRRIGVRCRSRWSNCQRGLRCADDGNFRWWHGLCWCWYGCVHWNQKHQWRWRSTVVSSLFHLEPGSMPTKKRRRKQSVILLLLLLVTILLPYLYQSSTKFDQQYRRRLSPRYHYQQQYYRSTLLPPPVIVPSLDYASSSDLGGYIIPKHRSFRLWTPLYVGYTTVQDLNDVNDRYFVNDTKATAPDFGGLNFTLTRPFSNHTVKPYVPPDLTTFHPLPIPNDPSSSIVQPYLPNPFDDINPRHRKRRNHSFDSYFRKATGASRTERIGCRPVGWASRSYPNCNLFHEFGLERGGSRDMDYDSQLVSEGYYRDVWEVKRRLPQTPFVTTTTIATGFIKNTTETETGTKATSNIERTALKTLKYKFATKPHYIEQVTNDAVVMERLTASPRIISMYGYCSRSIYVEHVGIEVEEVVVPGEGYPTKREIEQSKGGATTDSYGGGGGESRTGPGLAPRNHYTPTEKLNIALEMAESIADLHGFKDGVIVHDDIQLCQWMRRESDGKMLLGDFNRATVMEWNVTGKGGKGEGYCRFDNGGGYGNYRSPEEFAARDLDEKIDVFSYGNNIYGLLTGLWVFYENASDDGIIQTKLIDGTLPEIHDRYRYGTYAEQKLVEILDRCWIYDADERIDIFEVVKLLRSAVKENKRLASSEVGNG